MKPCSISDCQGHVSARGWCSSHYNIWRRHGDPLKRTRNPNGLGSIGLHGYRVIGVNGKRYLEHRFVMERALGRTLSSNECVHHIDGNKLNNSITNLCLTTYRDHKIHHHSTFRNKTHKECSRCHAIKPRTEFDKQHRYPKKDPNYSQCISCSRIAMVLRRKTHPEHYRRLCRECHTRHKEKRLIYKAMYRKYGPKSQWPPNDEDAV